ncbi:hypothetical protein PG984_002376 [Apiospora sp. TS-2023a]
MRGYPWRASGNDVVHSRRLINRIVGAAGTCCASSARRPTCWTSGVAAMQRVKRLQAHRLHSSVGDCYELKMWGSPSRSSGGDSMAARVLVLDLLSILESQGWSVYASIR